MSLKVFFSSEKSTKILGIVFVFFLLVDGYLFYQYYQQEKRIRENKKGEIVKIEEAGTVSKTDSAMEERIKMAKKEIKARGGSRSFNEELSAFSGEVKEKGEDFFILEGEEKIIRVEFNDQTKAWEIPWVIENMSQFIHEDPKLFDLVYLKSGDFVDVVGKYENEGLLVTQSITVYR